jgi:hypothetical protein
MIKDELKSFESDFVEMRERLMLYEKALERAANKCNESIKKSQKFECQNKKLKHIINMARSKSKNSSRLMNQSRSPKKSKSNWNEFSQNKKTADIDIGVRSCLENENIQTFNHNQSNEKEACDNRNIDSNKSSHEHVIDSSNESKKPNNECSTFSDLLNELRQQLTAQHNDENKNKNPSMENNRILDREDLNEALELKNLEKTNTSSKNTYDYGQYLRSFIFVFLFKECFFFSLKNHSCLPQLSLMLCSC